MLKLRERRLVTESSGGGYASHPAVKEYFAQRARQSEPSLVPIHRMLAGEYLKDTTRTPRAFDEAAPLLAAARHAAASEEWTLFDEIYRRRLMRVDNYLCNNLGAWEEALALARLGHEPVFPRELTPEPAYYPAMVARCLKHLGRSTESRSAYHEAFDIAAQSRDPNTARYVNNFLTLLISCGELARADMLVELNIRALGWIDESWKYCWQFEQAFSSVSYLRMLQGDVNEAVRLLDLAERAWNAHPDGQMKLFIHYYHRSELILLTDPSGHAAALEATAARLSVARDELWPESVCRGHIQAARVYLDRCHRDGDALALVRADQHLQQAQENAEGMIVPEVEIRHLLTRVMRYLVQHPAREPKSSKHVELSDLVARASARVDMSALDLASSEVCAARGALAYLRGSSGEAHECYTQAIEQCRAQGNAHAGMSGRSLVCWLGTRLGHERVPVPPWRTDPSAILGAGLTAQQMSDQLTAALAGERQDG